MGAVVAGALQPGGSQAHAARLPASHGLQLSLPLHPSYVSRVPLGDLGPAWQLFQAVHDAAVEQVCA